MKFTTLLGSYRSNQGPCHTKLLASCSVAADCAMTATRQGELTAEYATRLQKHIMSRDAAQKKTLGMRHKADESDHLCYARFVLITDND